MHIVLSRDFYEKTLLFLPRFLTSLDIFIVGLVFGFFSKKICHSFMTAANLDGLFDRSGTVELLKKRGIREPVSLITSQIIGLLVLMVFALLAVRVLQIPWF